MHAKSKLIYSLRSLPLLYFVVKLWTAFDSFLLLFSNSVKHHCWAAAVAVADNHNDDDDDDDDDVTVACGGAEKENERQGQAL